jgi:hypothetical protein
MLPPGIASLHAEDAPDDCQAGIRRDDVHLVRLHLHPVRRGADRHRRRAAEQIWEHAAVAGIQMLHHHERHTGVGRELREELTERLEPARGRAYSDDCKG